MRDDFLTRDWADNHSRMSAGIDKMVHRLGVAVMASFAALNRAQFNAPWRCERLKSGGEHRPQATKSRRSVRSS